MFKVFLQSTTFFFFFPFAYQVYYVTIRFFCYRLGIDIDDLSDLDSEEESDSSPRQHNSSSNENSCDAYQQNDISKSCDAKFQSDSSTSNSCDNIQDIDDGKQPENNKSNTLHDGIENNESMEKPIGLLESLKSVVPKENVEIDGNTCNKVGILR